MDLQQFLKENPEINVNQLAKKMYPNNKYAGTKLAHKFAETKGETGAQRFTESDKQRSKDVLAGLAKRILEYIEK